MIDGKRAAPSQVSLLKNPYIDQWLDFALPGEVTLRVGKVDIGQGISTALAQIAAEELDVGLKRITPYPVNSACSADEGVTSGSLSVEHSGNALRLACATIRSLAISRFCQKYGVASDTVMIEDGRLSSTSCENSDTYWELELSPSWPELVKLDAPLKMRSAYQTVGTSARRWDSRCCTGLRKLNRLWSVIHF